MLSKVIPTQRDGFICSQETSEKCGKPIPSNIGLCLPALIRSSRVYEHTVKKVRDSQNEFKVRSMKGGSKTKKVVLPRSDHVIPSYCGYSTRLDGFTCLNGVAILCDRIGLSKLYLLISRSHLCSNWTEVYAKVLFSQPSQADIDYVVSNAKVSVLKGTKLHITKALPPLRVRTVKIAGVRKKGWFEKAPGNKKERSYA